MTPAGGPFGRIHSLRTELNRLLELLLEDPVSSPSTWLPPVDLVEREDRLEAQVELPGVKASELALELVDQKLVVRGSKARLSSEPPGGRFCLMERFIGPFAVTVELPHPVQPDASSARLQHGVLTVRLPRLVERRHRRFPIPVDDESGEGR
jgi:HSP20 family protein